MSSGCGRTIATSLGTAIVAHCHRRLMLICAFICLFCIWSLLPDQLGRVAQLKKRFTEKNTKVNSSCDTHAAKRREY